MSFSFHVINHKFFIFTAEEPPAATQRPRRGQGSRGGRRSGTRGRSHGRGRTGADDESESPPPVASTAAKKTGRDGPRFPPEPPPTLLLTERDYTEAETIRTEHQDRQEGLSAFDAYNEVVRKAEVMQSTMINEMGDAFRNRKVDTYAIRVRNAWGVAYISQVQIVCIPPHQLAPGEMQPNILVKSLTKAVTGADVLDDLLDNAEPDPEIPSQFLRTQTQDRERGVRVTPHRTPLAESPPPPPIMAEDGRPAVQGKEDGNATASTCAKVSCM